MNIKEAKEFLKSSKNINYYEIEEFVNFINIRVLNLEDQRTLIKELKSYLDLGYDYKEALSHLKGMYSILNIKK